MTWAALFFTALAVGFSGALAPGPLLTAVISQTVGRGARGGLLAVAGHGLLELAMVLALAAGAGRWLAWRPVSAAIGLAGGAVLLWMGAGMLRGAARLSLALERAGLGRIQETPRQASAAPVPQPCLSSAAPALPAGGPRAASGAAGPRAAGAGVTGPGPLWAGVITSLANPYWTLWWATVGAGYMSLAAGLGPAGAGVFFCGHYLSDFVWYAAVTAAVAGGRRLLPRWFYRALLLTCGAFLLVMGAVFAVYGSVQLASPGR